MAKTSDLELFERAYRRRSSADDALLKQVFGEKGLEDLVASKSGLLETARTYFPHLTSSTYERLCREPDSLQLEKARCEREMEQLAVQNYGAFIGSAKVTQAVRSEVVDIQRQLEEMGDILAPIQEDIQEFQTFSSGLVTRRAALRNVLQQHGSLLELLEVPQLLDASIRNQMYEESLELLTYCGNMLQAHEARGEEILVLSKLKDQVAVQRANLQISLISQLMTDIHLPACVRVIGFLRRTHRYSEEELRSTFIQHRGSFLDKQKQQIEVLRSSRGSLITALKNAADLLRMHVYDIGTQYQALFQQDDGPLIPWLNEQIAWLTSLLRAHVLPERSAQPGASPSGASRGPSTGVRIDAASLMLILRQCMHASMALRRLGGHFFPAVAGMFDQRMEHHICEMLDVALLTFHSELGRYDWIPSTALTSNAAAAAVAAGGSAASAGAGWLHPQALDLTRHRPVAVFTNDLVQVFNEVRQCPLHALRAPMQKHLFESLAGAVNLLRSVKGSQALQVSPAKASEFLRACRQFAEILVPLMASHLEAVFGSSARLDTGELIASMYPDLLPPEAAYSPEDEGTSGAEASVGVGEPAPESSPESSPSQAAAPDAAAAAMFEAEASAAAASPSAPASAAVAASPEPAASPVAVPSATAGAEVFGSGGQAGDVAVLAQDSLSAAGANPVAGVAVQSGYPQGVVAPAAQAPIDWS